MTDRYDDDPELDALLAEEERIEREERARFDFTDEERERYGRILDRMVAGTATDQDREDFAALVAFTLWTREDFDPHDVPE